MSDYIAGSAGDVADGGERRGLGRMLETRRSWLFGLLVFIGAALAAFIGEKSLDPEVLTTVLEFSKTLLISAILGFVILVFYLHKLLQTQAERMREMVDEMHAQTQLLNRLPADLVRKVPEMLEHTISKDGIEILRGTLIDQVFKAVEAGGDSTDRAEIAIGQLNVLGRHDHIRTVATFLFEKNSEELRHLLDDIQREGIPIKGRDQVELSRSLALQTKRVHIIDAQPVDSVKRAWSTTYKNYLNELRSHPEIEKIHTIVLSKNDEDPDMDILLQEQIAYMTRHGFKVDFVPAEKGLGPRFDTKWRYEIFSDCAMRISRRSKYDDETRLDVLVGGVGNSRVFSQDLAELVENRRAKAA